MLVVYSLTFGNVSAAQKASQLTPKDAEPHLASAAILSRSGAPDQSVVELERAVALRPADYQLWSELGLMRDQVGDTAGSLKAFDESIKRAPYYAQPRWSRGNVYLRSGQYEAAFNDLTSAAESNQELIPGLIDIAWGIARGNVKLTEELARIKGDRMRVAFAKLLAYQGKGAEAVEQFDGASRVPESTRQEMVLQLISKGAFKEAFHMWSSQSGSADRGKTGSSIYDGGFEGTLAFGETGFGWRVPGNFANSVSLDDSQPQSGAKNLRIEFKGNSSPTLAQLVLVEPSQRYQINFASRSQNIVTGGLPILVVNDAAKLKALGQSQPLPQGTTNWQVFSFEFTTAPTTSAVLLNLQRQSCSTSLCPIFGSIALDSFSVQQMK